MSGESGLSDEIARKFCPACGRPDVTVGLDSVLYETRPTFRAHVCGLGGPGSRSTEIEVECVHEWLDRPESDTRECLICGAEVAG